MPIPKLPSWPFIISCALWSLASPSIAEDGEVVAISMANDIKRAGQGSSFESSIVFFEIGTGAPAFRIKAIETPNFAYGPANCLFAASYKSYPLAADPPKTIVNLVNMRSRKIDGAVELPRSMLTNSSPEHYHLNKRRFLAWNGSLWMQTAQSILVKPGETSRQFVTQVQWPSGKIVSEWPIPEDYNYMANIESVSTGCIVLLQGAGRPGINSKLMFISNGGIARELADIALDQSESFCASDCTSDCALISTSKKRILVIQPNDKGGVTARGVDISSSALGKSNGVDLLMLSKEKAFLLLPEDAGYSHVMEFDVNKGSVGNTFILSEPVQSLTPGAHGSIVGVSRFTYKITSFDQSFKPLSISRLQLPIYAIETCR